MRKLDVPIEAGNLFTVQVELFTPEHDGSHQVLRLIFNPLSASEGDNLAATKIQEAIMSGFGLEGNYKDMVELPKTVHYTFEEAVRWVDDCVAGAVAHFENESQAHRLE